MTEMNIASNGLADFLLLGFTTFRGSNPIQVVHLSAVVRQEGCLANIGVT